MSGLPEPFGVVLLVFSLILLLTPYFSGAGFGLFTIPIVNERAKKLLKIIGPLLFVSCILFFVPIFPNNKQAASTTSSSSPLSPTPSTELAKTDTNGSKIGNLPVNANNAEPIKTLPSSDEASNASSECTEKPYAIISNFDDDAYNGNPSSPTEFSIKEKPLKITNIYTRHRGWKGIPPPGAVIKLRNSAGKDLGSWRVTSGNEEWVCSPNIQLPVGTYRVIDPDPATWSQNVASEHKGMTRVEGCPTAGKPK
jgi:hypothetical protein